MPLRQPRPRPLARPAAGLLVALGLCLALPSLAQAPSAPQPKAQPPAPSGALPFQLKTDRLPNGLTVVRVPFKSPGLVAYYTAVRVGSRNEVEPGRTGFAHFFEHMMFRGTPRYPGGAGSELLAKNGFNSNAFTSDDITVYTLYGPSAALETLVDVEADRFQNLQYSEPAFQTEAKAVLGEYHKNAARPELKLSEAQRATAFTSSPYAHTTLGFYEDIQRMPELYAYSRTFFERWYTPDNVLLFVVGDFDDAKLMSLVREKYGPWKGRAARVTIPQEKPQTAERKVAVEWPSRTLPRHVHSWRTPAARVDTLDGAVAELLGDYLAGPTSPLYRTLVLEKQVVQGVFADGSPHRDPYLFSLHGVLKDEKHRADVAAAFDAAVKEVASGKVDARRLADLQSNSRYGALMALETADRVAVSLARYAGILGTPDALGRHLQNLAKVQPQHLVAFARKHLKDSNRTVVTLTVAPPAQKVSQEVSK